MDVLIFAIEPGDHGPGRLPLNLMTAGIAVNILCPPDSPLAWTSYCHNRFALPASRSGRRLAASLNNAVRIGHSRMIIPADAQAQTFLHHLGEGAFRRQISPRTRDVIRASIGSLDRLATLRLRSLSLALARSLGIRVPASTTVATAYEADLVARAKGFPVLIQSPVETPGNYAIACHDRADVARAMAAFRKGPSLWQRMLSRFAHENWLSVPPVVDVQRPIVGRRATYCALAWRGQLAGGFASYEIDPHSRNETIEICHDLGMEECSRELIELSGAHGFVGLDYAIDAANDDPVFLGCTSRAVGLVHLGSRAQCDLAGELAALLKGSALRPSPLRAKRMRKVCLFPYALVATDLPDDMLDDIPATDRGLMAYAKSIRPKLLRRRA